MLDVEAMRDRLSHRAFAGWVAYASIEPFGEERADLRAGIIASTIANANRDRKKRPEPFSPRDFMPSFDERPASPDPSVLTPDQLSDMMKKTFPKPEKPTKKKGRR